LNGIEVSLPATQFAERSVRPEIVLNFVHGLNGAQLPQGRFHSTQLKNSVPNSRGYVLAKATGQRLTEKTLFTNFAQMIGTPLYLSPEQAQMSGGRGQSVLAPSLREHVRAFSYERRPENRSQRGVGVHLVAQRAGRNDGAYSRGAGRRSLVRR
jgi:hypothetical protein